ncbi:amidohydrolase family protein [Halocynthiibacter sp. C4]|uniref:amidohydrolase family protein n=1 Tax=Halocynthiibacter sp. C4 TaxID=2992758 RepID=UPI00237B760C|nr:amidohydrolase family protein [Halocynthiibacter sp. C4]MDE0590026.1 amidohydrolase family protein [Halocynthiibacter sp. C4]
MIDTHVHVLDPEKYPYPPDSLGYTPGPEESGTLGTLEQLMDAHGIEGAVLVAASVYGDDNRAMLDAFAAHPDRYRIIAGVSVNDVKAIEKLAATPGVVGIRLNLVDDSSQSGATTIARLMDAALEAGLSVSVQAAPTTAANVLTNVREGHVILDHFGRPDLEGGIGTLREISQRPDTWLKLSAGFRIAGSCKPSEAPLLREAVAAFSEDRLIWGSDWPFINFSGQKPDYASVLQMGPALSKADFARNSRALFWEQT